MEKRDLEINLMIFINLITLLVALISNWDLRLLLVLYFIEMVTITIFFFVYSINKDETLVKYLKEPERIKRTKKEYKKTLFFSVFIWIIVISLSSSLTFIIPEVYKKYIEVLDIKIILLFIIIYLGSNFLSNAHKFIEDPNLKRSATLSLYYPYFRLLVLGVLTIIAGVSNNLLGIDYNGLGLLIFTIVKTATDYYIIKLKKIV
ncbi:MAG: DUF6498-containing protein [Candidatus Pacearchaeota archaeon]|jgi:hypothetical protein